MTSGGPGTPDHGGAVPDDPLTPDMLEDLQRKVAMGFLDQHALVRARHLAATLRQQESERNPSAPLDAFFKVARESGIDIKPEKAEPAAREGGDGEADVGGADSSPIPASSPKSRSSAPTGLPGASSADGAGHPFSTTEEPGSADEPAGQPVADPASGDLQAAEQAAPRVDGAAGDEENSPDHEPAQGRDHESSTGDAPPFLLKHSKPMSERRKASQKANAARSKGPTTAEGKAVSSMNRLVHGFDSRRDYIPRGPLREDPDQVHQDMQDWVRGLKPVNRVAYRAAVQVARVMRREGLLERALILRATVVSADPAHGRAAYSEALVGHRRETKAQLEDALAWVDQVYEATAAAGSWDWRKVLGPTLRDGRAEAFCWLLNGRGLGLFAGDLYGDEQIRPTTQQGWEHTFRHYLEQHFDANIDTFASWCESQIPKIESEIDYLQDTAAVERSALDMPLVRDALPDVARILDLTTKNSRALAVAYAFYKEMQALGPDDSEDSTDVEDIVLTWS